MSDGQPTFQGTPEEQDIAAKIFDLMALQGQSYAIDAPIRQSLRNLVDFFLSKGLYPNASAAAAAIEAAVKANGHVFYRQETDGEVFYITSRRGRAVRPSIPAPARYVPPAMPLPVAGRPAQPEAATPSAAMTVKKPSFVRRETPPVTEARPAHRGEAPLPHLRREPKAMPQVQAPPPPPRRPYIVTPSGETVYMDRPAEEILETHGAFFQNLVAECLAGDPRFVSFGQEWFLRDMLIDFTKGDLRRVRQAIEENGDVLADTTLLTDLFNKDPDDDDFEIYRFSLNYALFREKREFEFKGTNDNRLWGVLGMASPRQSRSPLRPSEIGQDLKYLEDEPPITDEGEGRWVHSLTFYEIENGLLPYTPAAKLILPRPLLKDQRVAILEFRAPQLNLTVVGELHYPVPNRGGWVDGLEEILDHFIPGARIIVEGTEREDVFLITYRRSDPVSLESIRYDEKKGRYIFAPVVVNYQVDESMLITKERYKNLANARRLDENSRRKGDLVISFAFTKVGTRHVESGGGQGEGEEEEGEAEKVFYRAHIKDLLPIVNLEKPFSRNSLVRFMTTHPHYRKDESEEGYYIYRPTG